MLMTRNILLAKYNETFPDNYGNVENFIFPISHKIHSIDNFINKI